MGLLGKLFGGKTVEQRRERARELIREGDHGGAKIELERALEKSTDNDEREAIQDEIDDCCDVIAERRVEEAKRLRAQGDVDLARMELEGALEVAVADETIELVQSVIDSLEQTEAVDAAEAVEKVSDEERWVLISGSWEDPQADEYEDYGDDFVTAVLAVHDGRPEDALPLLEAVLEDADAPRYLWLEVGRARLLCDDREGGRDALVEFVDSLAEDEVGDALLAAYIELARIAHDDEEFEEAMAFYQRAIEEFDNDHRPYLAMGIFLRDTDHLEEAIDVMEAGSSLMDDIRPDWRMMQELGHAYAMAERHEEAIAQLEGVIAWMTSRQLLDFPPRTAETLAELHETTGKLDRAADLYAALAKGSDVDRHAHYYAEAARLLAALGLDEEARRMFKRALALSEDDEQKAKIESSLSSLA